MIGHVNFQEKVIQKPPLPFSETAQCFSTVYAGNQKTHLTNLNNVSVHQESRKIPIPCRLDSGNIKLTQSRSTPNSNQPVSGFKGFQFPTTPKTTQPGKTTRKGMREPLPKFHEALPETPAPNSTSPSRIANHTPMFKHQRAPRRATNPWDPISIAAKKRRRGGTGSPSQAKRKRAPTGNQSMNIDTIPPHPSSLQNKAHPLGIVMCPITSCTNNHGKGYTNPRSFAAHVKTQHAEHLESSSEEHISLKATLSALKKHICSSCRNIVALCSANGNCRKCEEHTTPATHVKLNPLEAQKQRDLIKAIETADRKKLLIIADIPAHLRRLWSNCVQATLLAQAQAKTETEVLQGMLRYSRLKSVLIKPIKGGKGRRKATKRHLQQQMKLWLAQDYEGCWEYAVEVERQRMKTKKRLHQRKTNKNLFPNHANVNTTE